MENIKEIRFENFLTCSDKAYFYRVAGLVEQFLKNNNIKYFMEISTELDEADSYFSRIDDVVLYSLKIKLNAESALPYLNLQDLTALRYVDVEDGVLYLSLFKYKISVLFRNLTAEQKEVAKALIATNDSRVEAIEMAQLVA